jgi:glycosyltransferase involved in cell wall biosynthesis
MNSALREQRAGNLALAETLYREVLRRQPEEPDTLHMLGVICYQTQRPWEAFEQIYRALELTGWQVPAMRDNFCLVLTILSAGPPLSTDSLGDGVDPRAAMLKTAKQKLRSVLPLKSAIGTDSRMVEGGVDRARVLVVDSEVPAPDRHGGSLRAVGVMRILRQLGCRVSFASRNMEFAPPYGELLQQDGIEVLHRPYFWTIGDILEERGHEFDMVIASHYYVASAICTQVRRHAPRALFVFDTVDLHYLREERGAFLQGDAEAMRNAAITRRNELDVVRMADVTLVVTTVEQAILQREVPGRTIVIVPDIHVSRTSTIPFESRRDLFFVGGYRHAPNVDAVRWFAREVWPLVHRQLPHAKALLIGSEMPDTVAALAGDGIEACGHVPDLTSCLEQCRVSIAPLRYGAGVKVKINLAQSWGIPVVATTVAAEGMQLEDGRDVLLADTPEDFARAIARLYTDRALWTAISEGGRANVARHFSPEAAAITLDELVRMALAGHEAAARA